MRRSAYRSAIAAVLFGSAAITTAGEVNLTSQQRETIMQDVQSEKGQSAPAGFLPRIGAAAPRSLSMRQLPFTVATQVPIVKDLRYAKLDTNEVLLIDPKDRRVAKIIIPSGTTGVAPGSISPVPVPLR